jgi:hypothetical protein
LHLFLCILCFIPLPCYCLFPFSCFTLLFILSLTLHFVVACFVLHVLLCYYFLLPFALCHVVAYTFLCASPCCCPLPPSHFTLQLLVPSFALHFVAACSLPCTSLCNCLFPPSCLVLLLHIHYLAFHLTTTCSFPHASLYFLPTPLHFILCSTLELKYYYHSLSNDVLLPTPSHFTLMFALCQLVFPPSFIFTSERTRIKLGVWSLFNLVGVFLGGNFWVFYWIETR